MPKKKKLLVLNWKMAFSVPQTCVTAHVIYEFDEVSTLVWEAAGKVFWQHWDGILEPALRSPQHSREHPPEMSR